MKALISADWHLADNPRDEYRWGFVEKELPAILQEEGIDLLLFLGDVTEAKSGHSAELVNRIVKNFRQLAKTCPVVCLSGNHDGLNSDHPFFEFLSSLQGGAISWVRVPTPLSALPNVPAGFSAAERTLLLPNTRNPERDWENLDFEPYSWVFAHQCFIGAKSESGFTLGGTSMSFFPKDVQIISGDIHKPQALGKLTYVGSPYTIDHGDDFDPRVLLWNGTRVESLRCFGPQKQLVDVKSVKELAKRAGRKGDIVKVRLEVESYEAWPEAKRKIEEWAAEHKVVLHLAQPIITASKPTKTVDLNAETLSDEDILKAYAKKHDLNSAYVQVGLKFL